MEFSPYSVSQVCGMVSTDRWVCNWSRVIHGFIYWKRLWEVVTRLQEISFKELCIWASIVFISFFLLIPYLPPLAQTLLQDYIDISNINWENLAMTCLSWGGYPQEHWAASRNCGVVSVFSSACPMWLLLWAPLAGLVIHDIFSESLLCATNTMLGSRDTNWVKRKTVAAHIWGR